MPFKDLIIINNEKISEKESGFYCDNIDLKSIPEDLNKKFKVTLIARKSRIQRTRKINLNKIETSSNIFSFLFNILKKLKRKENIYLIISITPYTFFSYLLLFLFNRKVFVYLRSNGYEEYKAIFGFIGPLLYHLMFTVVTFKSKILTCQERLFKKEKQKLVFPSELDSMWFDKITFPDLDAPRLLYIGRLKVEKGIFSFLKIFEKTNINSHLTIVGRKEGKFLKNKNVDYIGHGYNATELINIYDKHNILILPSYTEAHPKVVDESLARMRPVIIFEEIKHIIKNKKGIFVSKRDEVSLVETISFIMTNYKSIQEGMKNNVLPTKQEFISQMSEILESN